MLISLAAQWQIDLRHSWIIGDSWKDMAAGKSAGCQTILLDRQYNVGTEADFKAANVLDATDLILNLTSRGNNSHGIRHRVFS